MAYRRILKSTAYMGLSSGISAIAGLLRGKFVAVLFGAACVGMMGLLNQHYTMLLQVCGLGLSNSALRHVSEHRAERGDEPEVEALVFALKLGLVALIIGLPVSLGVCYFSFGNFANWELFILAGLAAVPAILTLAQVAILQARGEIARLAKRQSISAVLGLVASAFLIGLWGEYGVALSILISSLIGVAVFYNIVPLSLPARSEWFRLSPAERRMAILGLTSFGVIALGNASTLTIRSSVVSVHGLAQAGVYFAAMAVAVNIPGFLFAPMFTDFYPRVAAAADDSAAASVTKSQLGAGLLLAGHFFVALVLWPEDLLRLFYSHEFRTAAPLVEWLAFGVALRLVSMPMGYWIMARCRPGVVMAIEGSATIFGTTLAVVMLPKWGIEGVGVAFCVASAAYTLFVSWFVDRRSSDGLLRHSLLLIIVILSLLTAAKFIAAYAPGHLEKGVFYAIVVGASVWGYRRAIRKIL